MRAALPRVSTLFIFQELAYDLNPDGRAHGQAEHDKWELFSSTGFV